MKKLSRKELIKRIDRLFQACRRFDGAKKKGDVWYNRCVTSGQVLPMSKIQGEFLFLKVAGASDTMVLWKDGKISGGLKIATLSATMGG